MRRLRAISLWVLGAAIAGAQSLPTQLEGVGITEKSGQAVDLGLTFIAENGYPVALRDFFHGGRPVLLNLVYYSCPMLCNLVLNGQTAALRSVPGTPGKDFEIVTISIDPGETFNLAQQKRAVYLESYGRPAPGWHFLVDNEGNAKRLADQVGFRYRRDESTGQFAHAAAIMILTPEGRVSRYLYGIKFNPLDLRLALAEAAQSKFTFSTDQLLLYCFHYDPQARAYVLFATNVMRLGGVLIVLIMGAVLLRLWRRERLAAPAKGLVVDAR
jgi:protein SCO1